VVLYWKTIIGNKKAWKPLLIAFLPTAIIGVTVYKLVKDVLLGNAMITVWALFLGGIALILLELLHKEKEGAVGKIEDITPKMPF